MTCEKFGRKCIFTGSTGDTGNHRVGAHWIYPPAAYGRASDFSSKPTITTVLTLRQMVGHIGVYRDMGAMDFDAENMQIYSNLVTMRADVHRLWLANAISVDVDVSISHESSSYLLCSLQLSVSGRIPSHCLR